jgi:hypothetical protein
MFEVNVERTTDTNREYLTRMWCLENFKDNDGQRWQFDYEKDIIKYYFQNKEDADLFKLIWA